MLSAQKSNNYGAEAISKYETIILNENAKIYFQIITWYFCKRF